MAIVVRLVDKDDRWKCVNRVAHITIGTRDDTVKPKESNDLLAKWLENGTVDDVGELVLDSKPIITGSVKGVSSR